MKKTLLSIIKITVVLSGIFSAGCSADISVAENNGDTVICESERSIYSQGSHVGLGKRMSEVRHPGSFSNGNK